MIRVNINGQDINDGFERIQEEFAWQSINPPTISLDLTDSQIKECKNYAYTLILEKFPRLRDKSFRENLHPSEKAEIVNVLTQLFEEKQYHLLEKQTKL